MSTLVDQTKHTFRRKRPPRLSTLALLVGALAALAWMIQLARRKPRHIFRTRWIDASPEDVFSAIADPQKPFLTENAIVNMKVVGDQTVGVGTTYRWNFFLPFGWHFAFDEVVTAWVPGRRIAYKATSGWDMVAETCTIPVIGGTRVTFSMESRLPLPFSLLPQGVINFGMDLALISLEKQVQGARGLDKARTPYIPALRFDWLTPVYDFAQQWIFRESIFKAKMVEQAHIEKGQRVLDLGCGTATLTVLIKKTHPDTEVLGLDGDPQVLGIARAKAAKDGVDITFDKGMAFQLPYPDESFDRVLSSLMFHRLTRENKYRAMREVLRVLKDDGEFLLADLGKQRGLMYLFGLILGGLEEGADNVKGLLPEMLHEVGFEQVEEDTRFAMPYGTVSFYRARKCR